MLARALAIGLSALGLCAWTPLSSAHAQESSAVGDDRGPAPVPEDVLPEDVLVVVGQRAPTRWLETPSAVGFVDGGEVQRAQQQLTLAESLSRIPGVFIQNRVNFAQDTRISIRGFGSRAAFGIRGLKLYMDDIPLTTPDGQGQVDSIDFGSIDRIEVLRGPSASLYGSSSGGVIRMQSESGAGIPMLEGRASFGSFGYKDVQLKGGGQAGDLDYMASVSGKWLDGYRDHAEMRNVLLNTKFGYEFPDASNLTLVLSHLDAPEAADPGALTFAEARQDPSQARQRNVDFDAGEALRHTTAGLVYRKPFNAHHETKISNYYTWRNFNNKLPFTPGGAVEYDRFFLGGGLKHEVREEWFGKQNRLSGGIDVDVQLDDRIRRNNEQGSIGAKTLDQREEVIGVGVYLEDEFELLENWSLAGSVRYDHIDFEVIDHFTSGGDPDDSGNRVFDEGSYAGSLLWSPVLAFNPYFRVSTSFQVPTTTELTNPDGGGGFNRELEPERALNLELGFKGLSMDAFATKRSSSTFAPGTS